jgi:hypothetical protein
VELRETPRPVTPFGELVVFLLGVSFIQLKLNRVRAKQCYSISEFKVSCIANAGEGNMLNRREFLAVTGTSAVGAALACGPRFGRPLRAWDPSIYLGSGKLRLSWSQGC